MKIENIHVYGFQASFHGMRNPLDSWSKSDSSFGCEPGTSYTTANDWLIRTFEYPQIGPEDMKLACKLIKGGSEHRKFLRQIQVWFDITVPIYVWSELDTYKVATVRNSCSTMHTLGLRDLTQNDFELPIPNDWLEELNKCGEKFRIYKIMKDTRKMNKIRREYKNLLPSGFLQKATYTMSYETALSMYFQRRNHRLSEWRAGEKGSICSFIESLPYMKEFIGAKNGEL
jgi:hypothetical protein